MFNFDYVIIFAIAIVIFMVTLLLMMIKRLTEMIEPIAEDDTLFRIYMGTRLILYKEYKINLDHFCDEYLEKMEDEEFKNKFVEEH